MISDNFNCSTLKSFKSPLLEQMHLSSTGARTQKKSAAAGLILTSLVDAFSILVIYLLFGPQLSGVEAPTDKNLVLPFAVNATDPAQETTIRINGKEFLVNGLKVSSENLAANLKSQMDQLEKQDKKTSHSLLIQADQSIKYADLRPVLVAASNAGISNLKFAVQFEGETK